MKCYDDEVTFNLFAFHPADNIKTKTGKPVTLWAEKYFIMAHRLKWNDEFDDVRKF